MDSESTDGNKPKDPTGPDQGTAEQSPPRQVASASDQAAQPVQPPLPEEDAAGETIRMPQFYGQDAEKQRRVLKRWLKLKRREAKRAARREKWLRRWQRIRPFVLAPTRGLKGFYAFIKSLLKAPFNALSEKLEASRQAKAAMRAEELKRNMPAREAAALRRWQARQAKQEAWDKRLAGFRRVLPKLKVLIPRPRRWYRAVKRAVLMVVLAPFQAIGRAMARAREERDAKLRDELAKTAKTREAIIQKKHTKLVMREMKRRERAKKRRERWAGVLAFIRRARSIWSNLSGVRKLVYLIVLAVLAWIYRAAIISRISKIIDFDLQSLMK